MEDKPFKLFYFDMRGRAEPIRWLLLSLGLPFEDIRLTPSEALSIEKQIPLQSLPLLETPNGGRIYQPLAILYYIGQLFGMCGKNDLELAMIETVIYTVLDLCEETRSAIQAHESSPMYDEKKLELTRNFIMTKAMPSNMRSLNKILHESGNRWLVGEKMSIADLMFVHWAEQNCVNAGNNIFIQWDTYPELRALNERVRSTSGIKEWLQIRPDNKADAMEMDKVLTLFRSKGKMV